MIITRVDKAVIFACVTIFITFLINAKLGSIWLLYSNVLITVSVFGYAIWKWDEFRHLSHSAIFGVIAAITYLPVDRLFSQRVDLIFYLNLNDIQVPAVPLSLLLTWMIAITVTIYFYQRLNSIWRRPYISSVITGVVVFIGSTVLDQLGSARLWNWNASRFQNFPYIGTVPVFVPIAILLTFLLSPYYLRRQHPLVAGLRCGLFLGGMQFLCFMLFHHLVIWYGL
jgi:hypothetical protein